MMLVASWNVRGLHQPSKQWEVQSFIAQFKLSLVVLLETQVQGVQVNNISLTYVILGVDF